MPIFVGKSAFFDRDADEAVWGIEGEIAWHVGEDRFFGCDAALKVFIGKREGRDDFEFIARKLVEQVAWASDFNIAEKLVCFVERDIEAGEFARGHADHDRDSLECDRVLLALEFEGDLDVCGFD